MHTDCHRAVSGVVHTTCAACGDRAACASTGLPLDDVVEIMRLLQVFSPEHCYRRLEGARPVGALPPRRVIRFLDGFSHICPRWGNAVFES